MKYGSWFCLCFLIYISNFQVLKILFPILYAVIWFISRCNWLWLKLMTVGKYWLLSVWWNTCVGITHWSWGACNLNLYVKRWEGGTCNLIFWYQLLVHPHQVFNLQVTMSNSLLISSINKFVPQIHYKWEPLDGEGAVSGLIRCPRGCVLKGRIECGKTGQYGLLAVLNRFNSFPQHI